MSACPRCGEEVACGIKDTSKPCWCMQYPGVLPVPAAGSASCYCAACLAQVIAEESAKRAATQQADAS